MRPKLVSMAGILCVWATTSGCSMYMALSGPGPVNRSVLAEGTPRSEVIRVLGAPASTRTLAAGATSDLYKAKDGWPLWFNVTRALAHGAGDFFTLFLWEVAAMPIEAVAFSPSDVTVEAQFRDDDALAYAVMRGAGGKTKLEVGAPPTRPSSTGALAQDRKSVRRR